LIEREDPTSAQWPPPSVILLTVPFTTD